MRRLLAAIFGTPFGLAGLVCLVLAGWALWSAGLLDGPVARQVRTSSVYAAPGIDLDQAAAERIIGNRRLVVVLLEPDADLPAGCHSLRRAAAGTVVLLLRHGDDKYDRYGCALLPDADGDNFGRALVTETTIPRGIDGYPDRPLEALKVITLNYDRLVKAGTIPDGARTVSPSLPRYLVAAAAILAVIIGSTVAYAGARRAGRLAAEHLARREAAADSRSELSAAAAVLAQQIIELDQQLPDLPDPTGRRYRQLATEYANLLDAFAATDDPDQAELARLTRRVDALSQRCRKLTAPT